MFFGHPNSCSHPRFVFDDLFWYKVGFIVFCRWIIACFCYLSARQSWLCFALAFSFGTVDAQLNPLLAFMNDWVLCVRGHLLVFRLLSYCHLKHTGSEFRYTRVRELWDLELGQVRTTSLIRGGQCENFRYQHKWWLIKLSIQFSPVNMILGYSSLKKHHIYWQLWEVDICHMLITIKKTLTFANEQLLWETSSEPSSDGKLSSSD